MMYEYDMQNSIQSGSPYRFYSQNEIIIFPQPKNFFEVSKRCH